jgi:hypothetical protein
MIEVDAKEVNKTLQKILDDQPRYLARAINDTKDRTLNKWIDLVQDNYTIKKSVKKFFISIPATKNNLQAIITFNAKKENKVGLIYYKTKATKRKGVYVEVIKGSEEQLRHAFQATMPSGHTGIFQRTGRFKIAIKGRYKGRKREVIKELYGPSLSKIFSRKEIMERIKNYVREELSKQLERQVERIKRGF